MWICLILLMLGLSAAGFIGARQAQGPWAGWHRRNGISAGVTGLLAAVMFAAMGISITVHNNRSIRELSGIVAIYPGAKYTGRINGVWLFETRDKMAAVASYYEALGSNHTAVVEMKDDNKYLVKMNRNKGVMVRIDDLGETLISYQLEK